MWSRREVRECSMLKQFLTNVKDGIAMVSQGYRHADSKPRRVLAAGFLMFVALTLVVPFASMVSAAESNPNDMIGSLGRQYNGTLNYGLVLEAYDSNAQSFRDVMNHVGITRDELVAAGNGGLKSWDASTAYSWGLTSRYSNETAVNVGSRTVYAHPLTNNNSGPIYGFVGHSKAFGWFGIMQDCGNLSTKGVPPKYTPPKPTTNPVPGVSINKTVNNVEKAAVSVNETFTYQVVVKNTGRVDLKNVVVSDPAPEGVEFVSADKGTITDNKWTYTIPALKIGQSTAFAIEAKVTSYKEGNIINTACVNAPEVNPNEPSKSDDCDDATVVVTENCPIPGKEHLPKNSSECVEKPVTPPTPDVPTVLPETGIGESISALIGLGSLIVSISYYVASRRAVLS